MRRLISRRTLLWGSIGTLGAFAVLGVGSLAACNRRFAEAAPPIRPAEVAARLAEALDYVFAPGRLARHWPEGDSATALVAAVYARPRLRAALATDCTASRRALVRDEISEDFATGDICVTDRLVVSRTECLIASLCVARPSLSNRPASLG